MLRLTCSPSAIGPATALIHVKARKLRCAALWHVKELGIFIVPKVDSLKSADNIIAHPTKQQGGLSLKDSLRQMRMRHDMIRALCDRLETLADQLPGPIDPQLHAAIETGLAHCSHAADADALLLQRHLETSPKDMGALWDQVSTMLAEQEGLTQELALALEPLGAGETTGNAEALGYMLRCFFQGYRRLLLIIELGLIALTSDHLSGDEWVLVSSNWQKTQLC